jgi:hypothetical protein
VPSGRHRPRVRGIEAWLVLVPFFTARLGVVTRFGLRIFIKVTSFPWFIWAGWTLVYRPQ